VSSLAKVNLIYYLTRADLVLSSSYCLVSVLNFITNFLIKGDEICKEFLILKSDIPLGLPKFRSLTWRLYDVVVVTELILIFKNVSSFKLVNEENDAFKVNRCLV
jgi:hypothetical protein